MFLKLEKHSYYEATNGSLWRIRYRNFKIEEMENGIIDKEENRMSEEWIGKIKVGL